jgi:hypothetical protein
MNPYGLRIYFVRDTIDKGRTWKPSILGLSREAVLRIQISDLEVLEQHSLGQLKEWKTLPGNILQFDFTVKDQPVSYQCVTQEGEIIQPYLISLVDTYRRELPFYNPPQETK